MKNNAYQLSRINHSLSPVKSSNFPEKSLTEKVVQNNQVKHSLLESTSFKYEEKNP